jgi:mannose-1-phosphate guanylyltransferase/phosphomannomutase
VTGFKEKPPKGSESGQLVNCGVYIVNKSVLRFVPAHTVFDFSRDLFPMLLAGGGKISAFIHDGYWCDIGDINSYYKANFDALTECAFAKAPNERRDETASYALGWERPSLISAGAEILGSVSGSIVGGGVKIARGAFIENCVILDGARVAGAHFDSIIGDGYSVSAGGFSLPAASAAYGAVYVSRR